MIAKQGIRNSSGFYKVLYARSFSNLPNLLTHSEDSGPKIIKENINTRFNNRSEENTTFPYSKQRFEKEHYGASKFEAQSPFELFCKEFKASSSKVPTGIDAEMQYFQRAWAELDNNSKEVNYCFTPLNIFFKYH
ncbi:hypothetical protein CONCODRAFT_77357 [Conidiobolus coronatus NRRL 28638]|uniref:Uncharacterized protein n=1 Tax=Conidiobolus coronatus (strain ATCC 28846 / CBS 209.66 / NRRL 28638) TaxID=796925 RepID=A0A137PEF9_CONC2|nr:hypothetical protein CONCODRAFT_77357 [Conidiobolus coronatus NRRL 28638]|eukprot:KXN73388.1 hypothetical protein CONCODRAFT_77357 [Conidiobolus coronatus NRRL 28638]